MPLTTANTTFVPGDSFDLYLVSTHPHANTWTVTLNRPGVAPEPAPRVDAGTWLSAYHVVSEHECAWEVGLADGEPSGTEIVIMQPELAAPIQMPHPGCEDIDPMGDDGPLNVFEF